MILPVDEPNPPWIAKGEQKLPSVGIKTAPDRRGQFSHRQNPKPDQNAEHQKPLKNRPPRNRTRFPPHPEGFLPGLSESAYDDHGYQRSDKNAQGPRMKGKRSPRHGGHTESRSP